MYTFDLIDGFSHSTHCVLVADAISTLLAVAPWQTSFVSWHHMCLAQEGGSEYGAGCKLFNKLDRL
jgi:hypothetical protein